MAKNRDRGMDGTLKRLKRKLEARTLAGEPLRGYEENVEYLRKEIERIENGRE